MGRGGAVAICLWHKKIGDGRMEAMVQERKQNADASELKGSAERDFGEHDESGVDVSLLRYMLQLTPLERLKVMEKHARDMATLHEYGRKHRETESRSNR